MHPGRIPDWSSSALKSALGISVFILVLFLFVDGIDWLIWGRKFDKDLVWQVLFVFCAVYFNSAIDSVHQHLNEIEHAVRNNNGEATT